MKAKYYRLLICIINLVTFTNINISNRDNTKWSIYIFIGLFSNLFFIYLYERATNRSNHDISKLSKYKETHIFTGVLIFLIALHYYDENLEYAILGMVVGFVIASLCIYLIENEKYSFNKGENHKAKCCLFLIIINLAIMIFIPTSLINRFFELIHANLIVDIPVKLILLLTLILLFILYQTFIPNNKKEEVKEISSIL